MVTIAYEERMSLRCIKLLIIDVTVSVPLMINIRERDRSVQVCATLYSTENIDRDFVVVLATNDGTGTRGGV